MDRYPEEKTCPSCDTKKPKRDFRFQHANSDGLNKHCNHCLSEGKRYKKKRKKASYEQNRKYNLKRSFGITPDDFNNMLEAQGGGCAICGDKNPDPAKKSHKHGFVVDHCHKSGHVRSVLCHKCNKAIGLMKDDPTIAQNASNYLSAWMRADQWT